MHVYPREMSIYGDLGNTRCLASRLRWHGYDARVLQHHPDEELPRDADLLVATAVQQWLDAAWIASADSGDLHDRLVKLVEKTLAAEAVDRAGGNRTAAAKALGLDRATLRAKLQG